MNKKLLLGTSFAAIFAVSMIMMPISIDAAHGSHLDIVNSKFKVKKGEVSAFVITADKIPTDGSAGAFGYGFITGFDVNGHPENVLALTTHLCAADSFEQGDASNEECPNTVGVLDLLFDEEGLDLIHDDETFHAHVLDLKPVTEDSACSDVEGSTLEVDIGRTLATENNISPDWPVKVKNNKISVSEAPVSDLQSEDLVAAVSFGIVGLADDENTITNLCLI